jgi:hypothetical protein
MPSSIRPPIAPSWSTEASDARAPHGWTALDSRLTSCAPATATDPWLPSRPRSASSTRCPARPSASSWRWPACGATVPCCPPRPACPPCGIGSMRALMRSARFSKRSSDRPTVDLFLGEPAAEAGLREPRTTPAGTVGLARIGSVPVEAIRFTDGGCLPGRFPSAMWQPNLRLRSFGGPRFGLLAPARLLSSDSGHADRRRVTARGRESSVMTDKHRHWRERRSCFT